jgi:hypothetical protein
MLGRGQGFGGHGAGGKWEAGREGRREGESEEERRVWGRGDDRAGALLKTARRGASCSVL